MRIRTAASAAIAATILSGCASPARPAAIQHVMLFDLEDPADARTLGGDAFMLMQAPVQELVTGPRIALEGRGGDPRWDAGITASFLTIEHYRQFLDHPALEAFLSRWRPRCVDILIAGYGPHCEEEPVPAAGEGGSMVLAQ